MNNPGRWELNLCIAGSSDFHFPYAGRVSFRANPEASELVFLNKSGVRVSGGDSSGVRISAKAAPSGRVRRDSRRDAGSSSARSQGLLPLLRAPLA